MPCGPELTHAAKTPKRHIAGRLPAPRNLLGINRTPFPNQGTEATDSAKLLFEQRQSHPGRETEGYALEGFWGNLCQADMPSLKADPPLTAKSLSALTV